MSAQRKKYTHRQIARFKAIAANKSQRKMASNDNDSGMHPDLLQMCIDASNMAPTEY